MIANCFIVFCLPMVTVGALAVVELACTSLLALVNSRPNSLLYLLSSAGAFKAFAPFDDKAFCACEFDALFSILVMLFSCCSRCLVDECGFVKMFSELCPSFASEGPTAMILEMVSPRTNSSDVLAAFYFEG